MPKDFAGVMHEWGQGELHSGSKSGPVVKNQKQAEAIAFSEDRKMNGPTAQNTPHHHVTRAIHHALGLAHHLTKLRNGGHLTAAKTTKKAKNGSNSKY